MTRWCAYRLFPLGYRHTAANATARSGRPHLASALIWKLNDFPARSWWLKLLVPSPVRDAEQCGRVEAQAAAFNVLNNIDTGSLLATQLCHRNFVRGLSAIRLHSRPVWALSMRGHLGYLMDNDGGAFKRRGSSRAGRARAGRQPSRARRLLRLERTWAKCIRLEGGAGADGGQGAAEPGSGGSYGGTPDPGRGAALNQATASARWLEVHLSPAALDAAIRLLETGTESPWRNTGGGGKSTLISSIS